MQGQLQKRRLDGAIHTRCACCGEPMVIEFSAGDRIACKSDTPAVISSPLVNIGKLRAPNIIDDF